MLAPRRRLGLLVAGLAGLLLAAPPAAAQTVPIPTAPLNGISVVGEGIVLAQPNTARVTLGTEVFQSSLAAAEAEASNRMNAVVQRLKAAGIPDTDIRTISFSITPQYDQRGDPGQSTLRGYQVQNLVEVRTTNVPGLGQLIDDVVGADATRVVGIAFEESDVQAIKDQARDQAM